MKNLRIASSQAGIGLIEVLISMLLLAIGVLGFVALQSRALQSSDTSIFHTESISIMRDLSERIRANPEAVETYMSAMNGALLKPAESCGAFQSGAISPCTPKQTAIADVYSVKSRFKSTGSKNVVRKLIDIQMLLCPGSPTVGDYKSYCLISAWNDTKPSIGGDSKVDCIKSSTGKYFPYAECIMMVVI